ncbi:MAG: DNA gyrase subunit A [Firmicutes bacterium]|nr:DNA gyrase subunit A [Bacillota bacterium]
MSLEFQDGKIVPIKIEEEMRTSYMNYAMSVIVERALPDVRDGLKPVQRRILFAMEELGNRWNVPHKKSARIVGEVMGKFHPHGDSAIYDAMVRMAQPFSYRYLLVDGHGNFGSVDGDPPAAMRYTEARLSRLAGELLRDLDKDTVDFMPNFDESLQQPTVLPSRFPNLLVNGASGIAVGMATNIPPHNLAEVIDGVIAVIDNPDITIKELNKIIPGPDFPTGALILGREGIKQAYKTGRGRIITRAKSQIEQMNNGKQRIIVTELPYMVNKANLITKIAELVRDKKIDGITDLRDESDKQGMRIVIELRRDANAHVVINRLYKHTQLQTTFGVIMLALVDGEPKVLNLKEVIQHYIEHQKTVVIRRSQYELAKAEDQAHIRAGLLIALDHIDEIITLIRNAPNEATAREQLIERFQLTEKQAVAILEMQLRRLTGLERDKIQAEYDELQKTIRYLREVLGDINLIYGIVKDELLEIRERYKDERRTMIVRDESSIDVEDLIAEEDIVVTLTHQGYIKRLPVDTYRSQRRGGRGITAIQSKTEDFVEHLFVTSTHNYVLFFTNHGKVYRLKGHEIPEASRNARGTAVVNLIQLDPGERIQAVIPISDYSDDLYLVMATLSGTVKKTVLSEYDSPRSGGLICISLKEDDELVSVKLTDGSQELIMVTKEGQAIRFPEDQVRAMGRAAHGVKGITLDDDDQVIAMDVVTPGGELLTVSETGYGKRTSLEEYRITNRGGKGVKTMNQTQKTGKLVGARVVQDHHDIMLISLQGIMIRMSVADISQMGRSTQGVILMKLQDENDKIVALAKLASKEDE